MGDFDRVVFCDLVVPQTLQLLRGHLSTVERLAWSRDNRHLVTLDNRFEVRIWDVMQGVSVDEFRPPPGGFFATNAAVALSDDARLVAYASGGEIMFTCTDPRSRDRQNPRPMGIARGIRADDLCRRPFPACSAKRKTRVRRTGGLVPWRGPWMWASPLRCLASSVPQRPETIAVFSSHLDPRRATFFVGRSSAPAPEL